MRLTASLDKTAYNPDFHLKDYALKLGEKEHQGKNKDRKKNILLQYKN